MLSSVLIVIGGLSVGFLFCNWSLPEVADRTTPFFRAGCHPSRHPSEEKVAHNGPLLRRVTDPFSKRPVVDNFQERRRDRSIPEHSQNISRELGNRPHIWRKRQNFFTSPSTLLGTLLKDPLEPWFESVHVAVHHLGEELLDSPSVYRVLQVIELESRDDG
jgi:hypothetical protein